MLTERASRRFSRLYLTLVPTRHISLVSLECSPAPEPPSPPYIVPSRPTTPAGTPLYDRLHTHDWSVSTLDMSRPLPATPSSSQLSLETGSTTPHVRPLPSLPSQVSLASTPTIQAPRPLPPPPPVPELKVSDARPELQHKSSQLSQLSRKASQSLGHKKSQVLAHKTSQSLSPHPSPRIDPASVPTPPSQPASQQPSPSVSTQPSPQPSPHIPHQPPPAISNPPNVAQPLNVSHQPNIPPMSPQSPSSPVSPSEKSHGGIVARLGKKKRQLSRDLLKFGQPEDEDVPPVPARPNAMSSPSLHTHTPAGPMTTPGTYGLAMTNSGEPFQMIAQHHMHTQGPSAFQSPSKVKSKNKPSTPGKPPRLNLGLFSSRSRKDSAPALGSASGRRPSAAADEHGVLHSAPSTDHSMSASTQTDHSLSARSTDHSARSTDDHLDIERASDVGSVRKRGSSTPSGAQAIASLFGRSPSPAKPATKSAGMAKSASSPGISSPPTTERTPLSAGNQPPSSWKSGQGPAPPPKPAKLKAQAQGILNTALGLGMSLGGRGSVGVLPSSPSIAAALEYMRHEERDPRGSISRRAVLDGNASDGGASSVSDLKSSESSVGGDKASVGGDKASVCAEKSSVMSGDKASVTADKASMSDAGKSISSDVDKSSMSDVGKSSFSDVGAETSSGPSSSVGSLLSSNTGTGTSASEEHYPFTGREPSASFDADASDSSVDMDHSQPVFNPAFSFNAHARPQPRPPQDPDKRVSTASSQRTLTAWNQKRESGIFSFPSEGTAPLARLHTSDGVVNAEDPGPNNPNPTTTDKEFNSPIPRPARLGQIAGSLKRRSASMSVLLPMLPPVETMPPPPLPPRRVPAPTDGAMTDSEGYMSSASQAGGRKWGRPQGGIKGKIAAWAAETPRKKHHRTAGGASTADAEPRRSDSPQLGQGYPYSHSPASAPTLQVHTHVHLPTHAQTPLMSIAALAPAARDLALGMGKRVEKFYRGRSASGAGYEPHPSMAGMRVASPGMGMGVGAEPMLSVPLRPATLGASGMLFGRPLDDPVVPRDMEGWIDETLNVRRCVGLPAFVSRSVKHLERWGGDEEGLFRISGRPSHVNRLRAEFDAGADYELSELPPSDLDPHAVSSLFKAYLRELPEPILTRALKPQFDMAMSMESSSNASFDVSKLPSSATSFGESSENMRSLDDTLLADIKALIDQLPQTNYVLLHELCHLLRYTTEHAHTTKMPIGNLLLLFCPTLGFSASFLKCLVEGQDTLFEWGRQPPATLPVASPVLSPEEPASPPPLPARTIKTSTSTISPPAKHAASASVAPLSVRSLKSPLNISTEAAGSPRMRSQTTGSAPPSRASMFFPNLGPKRPSINLLFGGNSQESRHSSGSSSSYGASDEEDVRVNPKRQTRPPRVSLDIPDGSFAPSLSPTKDANEEAGETDPSPSKRSAQTPIADLFKSPLTAAVPTTAPSTVTVTGTTAPAERWEPSKTLPPRIGLQLRSSEDADEMGWSRGVLDAASASVASANAKR